MNCISAVYFVQYLKMTFYISGAYLILVFLLECKEIVYKKSSGDIKALFLYATLFYIAQLLCMQLLAKLTHSKAILQHTLDCARVFPNLLFLLVVVSVAVAKVVKMVNGKDGNNSLL